MYENNEMIVVPFQALSAPLAALATYFCLNWSTGSSQSLDTFTATGIAMLFSAGTFLYVATVHVLARISGPHSTVRYALQ